MQVLDGVSDVIDLIYITRYIYRHVILILFKHKLYIICIM